MMAPFYELYIDDILSKEKIIINVVVLRRREVYFSAGGIGLKEL